MPAMLNAVQLESLHEHLPGFGKDPKTLVHEALEIAGNI
jgi:hypothetical protein